MLWQKAVKDCIRAGEAVASWRGKGEKPNNYDNKGE